MSEALTVAEFETAYKLSHTRAAAIIKAGDVASYKLGKRRYIARSAAEAWQRAMERRNAATLPTAARQLEREAVPA